MVARRKPVASQEATGLLFEDAVLAMSVKGENFVRPRLGFEAAKSSKRGMKRFFGCLSWKINGARKKASVRRFVCPVKKGRLASCTGMEFFGPLGRCSAISVFLQRSLP
jgi:hypothetical protein